MHANENSAVKTDFLIERINQNQNNQALDINEWAFGQIRGSEAKLNILELCCGTGKQTRYLLRSFPNARVSCLDLSADAINTVKKEFSSEAGRMAFYNSGLDEFFASNQERFDLIFVSYGLYYAKDIQSVFRGINQCMNEGGRFLVMGPHGKNNQQLFDVLTSLGVTLPYPVIHSSALFMYQDVIAFTIENFRDTIIHTTTNSVSFQTVESVMNYWKSSTFYDASRAAAFEQKVRAVIEAEGAFRNDKHIMLLEACK